MKLPSEFTVAIGLVLTIGIMLAISLSGIAVSAWKQGEGASSVLFAIGAGVCVYASWGVLKIALGMRHGH